MQDFYRQQYDEHMCPQVETLLAYFTTFQATVEEAEQVLSLLPHVAGHPDSARPPKPLNP